MSLNFVLMIISKHIGMRQILADFGFCGFKSLNISLLKLDNFEFIVVFSFMGTFLSESIGLQTYSLKILMILLFAELFFGIWAGIMRFGRFKAKRLERFGLKLFIYFLILLIFNTFMIQYKESIAEFYIYSSIHSFIVFYIIGVYLISVLENIHYITGKSTEIETLISIFKLKIFKATKKISENDDKINNDGTV